MVMMYNECVEIIMIMMYNEDITKLSKCIIIIMMSHSGAGLCGVFHRPEHHGYAHHAH